MGNEKKNQNQIKLKTRKVVTLPSSIFWLLKFFVFYVKYFTIFALHKKRRPGHPPLSPRPCYGPDRCTMWPSSLPVLLFKVLTIHGPKNMGNMPQIVREKMCFSLNWWFWYSRIPNSFWTYPPMNSEGNL